MMNIHSWGIPMQVMNHGCVHAMKLRCSWYICFRLYRSGLDISSCERYLIMAEKGEKQDYVIFVKLKREDGFKLIGTFDYIGAEYQVINASVEVLMTCWYQLVVLVVRSSMLHQMDWNFISVQIRMHETGNSWRLTSDKRKAENGQRLWK